MALSFNGLEPVEFGGKECAPKLDTELKMRLSQIKTYTEADDDVLASAFPDDEAYVKSFLKDKMTVLEKQTLHAYLLGGMTAVDTLMDGIKGSLRKAVDENQ